MSVTIVDKVGDVKIYGKGLLGGKGEGLRKINECNIPKTQKLPTRILSTVFYDRYRTHNRQLIGDELEPLAGILQELGNTPISVRSSATNEGCLTADGVGSVHAGENTSFMLPNNHPDFSRRLHQLKLALYGIYNDFIHKQTADSMEKMAIVINPIPGIFDQSDAGSIYYPLTSGVANSFFPYALKTQNPNDGFARIAFGHGYATVFDEFPVLSMATIRKPLPVKLLSEGQSFFYAIDMTKNETLDGHELETMKKLNIRFATYHDPKILGLTKNRITFSTLIQEDAYSFKSGLIEIMETISAKISAHYQIEFVFNIPPDEQRGVFHVVQLTQLPELKFEKIDMPGDINHTFLSISNLQGHGIKKGIKYAVVVSPFIYTKEIHDATRNKMAAINKKMRAEQSDYLVIVPGRLGSNNRDWGIQVDYTNVDGAVAIFEYGVDIEGRPEPVQEKNELTGGIYGSHFLYMIQGGHDEEQKRLKTRMYGTQGTHFLTNLMSNNIIYGYIAPNQDFIDPWFFIPESPDDALYVLKFDKSAAIYADSKNQRCILISEN